MAGGTVYYATAITEEGEREVGVGDTDNARCRACLVNVRFRFSRFSF